ncbi:MAG TPA: ABC transporter ATP-binding protein [Clostridiaceae bacterium]|jgi:ABC-2 type transport system ATP-binding protein|nr:ABC transporter ATP-binding protein [Clostridiaceae bacterium]
MNEGLTVRNLTKAMRGTQVLRNLSFDQPKGSIYGISGDNGAGKSTLLKILASVLVPDGGLVSFSGIPLSSKADWRSLIGYVPQEVALDDRLRVRETLEFWVAVRGMPASIRRQIVESAKTDPLISDFVNKPIRECSGGMARRASLVVGLFGDPALLLLDEPFSGADARSRAMMMERLWHLRSRGRTVLIASHVENTLTALCDRVLHLENGHFPEINIGAPTR